jgi:hypothetical protein
MKDRLIGIAIDTVLWCSLAALANVTGLWLASIVETIHRL